MTSVLLVLALTTAHAGLVPAGKRTVPTGSCPEGPENSAVGAASATEDATSLEQAMTRALESLGLRCTEDEDACDEAVSRAHLVGQFDESAGLHCVWASFEDEWMPATNLACAPPAEALDRFRALYCWDLEESLCEDLMASAEVSLEEERDGQTCVDLSRTPPLSERERTLSESREQMLQRLLGTQGRRTLPSLLGDDLGDIENVLAGAEGVTYKQATSINFEDDTIDGEFLGADSGLDGALITSRKLATSSCPDGPDDAIAVSAINGPDTRGNLGTRLEFEYARACRMEPDSCSDTDITVGRYDPVADLHCAWRVPGDATSSTVECTDKPGTVAGAAAGSSRRAHRTARARAREAFATRYCWGLTSNQCGELRSRAGVLEEQYDQVTGNTCSWLALDPPAPHLPTNIEELLGSHTQGVHGSMSLATPTPWAPWNACVSGPGAAGLGWSTLPGRREARTHAQAQAQRQLERRCEDSRSAETCQDLASRTVLSKHSYDRASGVTCVWVALDLVDDAVLEPRLANRKGKGGSGATGTRSLPTTKTLTLEEIEIRGRLNLPSAAEHAPNGLGRSLHESGGMGSELAQQIRAKGWSHPDTQQTLAELEFSLDTDVGIALHDAGVHLYRAGFLEGAEHALVRALDPTGAAGDLSRARTLDALGLVYADKSMPEQALAHHQEALALVRPGTRLHFRIRMHTALANTRAGRLEQAVTTFAELVGALGETPPDDDPGPGHVELAALATNLWLALEEAEPATIERAEPSLRALAERTDDALVRDILNAQLDQLMGKPPDRWRDYRPHADTSLDEISHGVMLNNLGLTLHDLGATEAAIATLYQAVDLLEMGLGPYQLDALDAKHSLGEVLVRGAPERTDEIERVVDEVLQRALSTYTPRIRAAALSLAAEWLAHGGALAGATVLATASVEELEYARLGMSEEVAGGFGAVHAERYRLLASLLARQDRLAEAEAVIRLLKAQETGVRSGSSDEFPAAMIGLEGGEGWTKLQTLQDEYGAMDDELRWLDEKGDLTADELDAMDGLIDLKDRTMEAFWDSIRALKTASMTDAGPSEGSVERAAVRALNLRQRNLRDSPDEMLVTTLIAPDGVHLLVTTADSHFHEFAKVDADDLKQAVLDLRIALTDPSSAPHKPAQLLHDWLIGPLSPHLERDRPTTLRLSLDGVLRYLPFAALHDGDQWLVERFAFVVDTPEGRLSAPSERELSISALGVSQRHEVRGHQLPALAGVPQELAALEGLEGLPVHTRLDPDFTEATLGQVLADQPGIVHIASHFVFEPGDDPSRSFLLLGDGEPLTIRAIESRTRLDFLDVQLLTLSACETAMSSRSADGREVESLAQVAQSRGARAVLATLWRVSDPSTAAWMAAVYGEMAEGTPVHQAARNIQLAVLRGQITGDGDSTDRGPVRAKEAAAELVGWTHPYYWAPFVILGNP